MHYNYRRDHPIPGNGIDEVFTYIPVSEPKTVTKRRTDMADLSPMELANMQQGLTDQQKILFQTQYNSVKKDRTIALILSILLGTLGIDRFYVGDLGMGILKLLTAGLFGVLWVIDWFLIMGRADRYNGNKAQEILAAIKSGQ